MFGGSAEPGTGSNEKQPKLADTTLLQFSELAICTYTVLNTKRVENAVFQSLDIFSVMVHAIETQDVAT